MGEAKSGVKRFDFDGHLRVEFWGAKVITDDGLLAVRELDEVLGLTEMAGGMLAEGRASNRRHDQTGLLRQSVYARLAGYEDVNDQEALSRDPAMRAVVGKTAIERNAASSATVARFETEMLATEDNLGALAAINGAWVNRAVGSTEARKVILDMDSSESPVHGNQEGSAYNGHFSSTCYHPLFCFNQHGDCEGAALRPGNVHSACSWHSWPLSSIQLKLIKIGVKVIFHSRRMVFQLAEVAVSEALFTKILARIHMLRYAPA